MKIHEYQAKAILARHGVPVPRGEEASTAAEAREIAKRLGGSVVVVKAQIHAGGRGKGGGVKLARSADEAERIARDMLGMTLVTHQTGPEGRVVGARARRRRPADDARAVSEPRARSRGRQARHDGERGRRHGHRGSGRDDAREDRHASTSSPASASCRSRRASSASRSASTARRSTSSSSWRRRSTRRSWRPTPRSSRSTRWSSRRPGDCWRSTRR